MKKITNPNYRQFLDKGIIDVITPEQIQQALKNVKGRFTKEGRSLLIALYYTGARPNEVLDIKGKDITLKDTYVLVHVKGSKGGLPRTIYLPKKDVMVQELYTYASALPPDMMIFYHFKNTYVRATKNKAGETKERTETTDKLRYHIKKWFKGVIDDSITTYFLRHNRFSKLSIEGVSMDTIRMLKGGKTMDSVAAYTHLSSDEAKKVARHMK